MPRLKTSLKAPLAGRRQQFSASTKRTLVDVATELFAARGYVGTSLDAIVAGAEVTKGALYHHFTGKRDLFEAVFEAVEADCAKSIRKSVKGVKDPWEKAATGLRAFLDTVREPAYQRIVIQDGPAILGYERFREQEERSSYGIVLDIVEGVLAVSPIDSDDDLAATFTRLFMGALNAAGASVSAATDPRNAVHQVEIAITFVLEGLRTLAEAPAPDADEPEGLVVESAEPDDDPGED